MNRNKLKTYAPQARRDFIQAVTDRAGYFGLTAKKAEPVTVTGDVAKIGGRPFPKSVAEQRKALDERVAKLGFEQVMEAVAYTWFNRLVAIRFMELHGYLDHGYRVLSHPEGKPTPEIVEHAEHVELPGLDKQQVIDLKLAGNKEEELYRILLIAQCNALHDAMPFLFERINDETELLLPTNLLHSDSLIRKLVNEIEEADWQEVEIIGWLYQFYISEKKDEVIGKVVKSEDIPAATQLFTPNWIVKYLVQNTLGRQWLATYPQSSLRQQMEYYIEPADQTPEVQEQLKAITPTTLNPEELTLLDPACGSGHILVEAYDLFKAIYQERGYRAKDIPALILQKNLFGLEIDDRAAQLASFALMMKARADDRRIFACGLTPNVIAIQDSRDLDAAEIVGVLNTPLNRTQNHNTSHFSDATASTLISTFAEARVCGSLLSIDPFLTKQLPALNDRVVMLSKSGGLLERNIAGRLTSLVSQAILLAKAYDVVVMNPPYLNSKAMIAPLKSKIAAIFPESKSDLFSAFLSRSLSLCKSHGSIGAVTPFVWMFLSSYEQMRLTLLSNAYLHSLIQLEYNAFEPACVPVATFVFVKSQLSKTKGDYIRLTSFRGHQEQPVRTLEAIRDNSCSWRFRRSIDDLSGIPGRPLAYWLPNKLLEAFRVGIPLGTISKARSGLKTWDNQRFLRLWFEVDSTRMTTTITNAKEPIGDKRWVPYNKGGPARRWGNQAVFVVDWEENGAGMREYGPFTSEEFYFREGITWSGLTSSVVTFRYSRSGYIFDTNKGPMLFPNASSMFSMLGFLNSAIVSSLLPALNPTLGTQNGDIDRLPILGECLTSREVEELSRKAVSISDQEWDSHELSWRFKQPLPLTEQCRSDTLRESILQSLELRKSLSEQIGSIEERNNLLYCRLYGLEPSELESIGVVTPFDSVDYQSECRSLVSYAVGCMMGRYSLNTPGLIYAKSRNKNFDASAYQKFAADSDGIVPITGTEWFADDAARRLYDFVACLWPRTSLEDNLIDLADGLGSRKAEPPREAIERYFKDAFFQHHLQIFKGPKHPPRPIYWLFTSGKNQAFQCLVYLHRYHPGTLSRMRTEYVIPLQGKLAARIEAIETEIAAESSTVREKKLVRERDNLKRKFVEVNAFDETLRHYADLKIDLNLDDGVKANYMRFGPLLSSSKLISSGGDE